MGCFLRADISVTTTAGTPQGGSPGSRGEKFTEGYLYKFHSGCQPEPSLQGSRCGARGLLSGNFFHLWILHSWPVCRFLTHASQEDLNISHQSSTELRKPTKPTQHIPKLPELYEHTQPYTPYLGPTTTTTHETSLTPAPAHPRTPSDLPTHVLSDRGALTSSHRPSISFYTNWVIGGTPWTLHPMQSPTLPPHHLQPLPQELSDNSPSSRYSPPGRTLRLEFPAVHTKRAASPAAQTQRSTWLMKRRRILRRSAPSPQVPHQSHCACNSSTARPPPCAGGGRLNSAR